jgi:hypothetical protein
MYSSSEKKKLAVRKIKKFCILKCYIPGIKLFLDLHEGLPSFEEACNPPVITCSF